MGTASVNKQSLREQVTTILRDSILSGVYPPGRRLSEPELAKRLGVSLTPVREALGSLAGAGLVVRAGRQGTHVRELRVRDVDNLLSVRETLEVLAVRQAIPHLRPEDADRLHAFLADQGSATELARTAPAEALPRLAALNESFHALILERAGNEWLTTMLAGIQDLLVFARARLRSHATVARRQQSLAEHRRIAHALIAGDQAEAVRAMSEHLDHLKRHVIALAPDLDHDDPTPDAHAFGRVTVAPRPRDAGRPPREAGELDHAIVGETDGPAMAGRGTDATDI